MITSSKQEKRVLASLYGATGRDKQARRLWRELLEINLGFSVERLRAVLPYKDPPWFERFADGLRRARIETGAA